MSFRNAQHETQLLSQSHSIRMSLLTQHVFGDLRVERNNRSSGWELLMRLQQVFQLRADSKSGICRCMDLTLQLHGSK